MPPFRDRIARFAVRSRGTFALEMFALWAAVVLASLAFLPLDVFVPGTPLFLLVLGPLALWRWSWGGLHFARAVVFSRITYPRMARRARAVAPRANHVGVIVMSWRIDPQVHAAVMDGIVGDLADYGAPATLVLSASDPADAVGLEAALERHRASNVRAVVAYQAGKGKRHGMYEALHVLAATGAPRNGITLLMDGDTYVPRGTLARTAPILLADRRIGALTIDNIPLVAGSALTREWYRLRMAQRYVYMCSLALSRKVLVLTGRWSLFRGELAMHPAFASQVLHDTVYHPRLGRIEMLTGEDKSTWHFVASRGWDTLFVPDVFICPMEELPQGGFVPATFRLMIRWFGNMVRGGARGLAIGPRRLGLFPWIVLLDQRVSMWTSLTAPLFFTVLAAVFDWRFLALFALWVSLSRLAQGVLVGAISRRFHVAFVYLLFYGQVAGAVAKLFVFFHPHVQRWTRQQTGDATKASSPMSRVLLALSIAVFVMVVFHAVDIASRRSLPTSSSEVLSDAR